MHLWFCTKYKIQRVFSYAWLVYNTKISLGHVYHNFCEPLFFPFVLLVRWGDQNQKYKFIWWHCIIILYIQHYEGCYGKLTPSFLYHFLSVLHSLHVGSIKRETVFHWILWTPPESCSFDLNPFQKSISGFLSNIILSSSCLSLILTLSEALYFKGAVKHNSLQAVCSFVHGKKHSHGTFKKRNNHSPGKGSCTNVHLCTTTLLPVPERTL